MSYFIKPLPVWHRDVATRMITASEEDRSRIVQVELSVYPNYCTILKMWDLRFAISSVKVFDKHQM